MQLITVKDIADLFQSGKVLSGREVTNNIVRLIRDRGAMQFLIVVPTIELYGEEGQTAEATAATARVAFKSRIPRKFPSGVDQVEIHYGGIDGQTAFVSNWGQNAYFKPARGKYRLDEKDGSRFAGLRAGKVLNGQELIEQIVKNILKEDEIKAFIGVPTVRYLGKESYTEATARTARAALRRLPDVLPDNIKYANIYLGLGANCIRLVNRDGKYALGIYR